MASSVEQLHYQIEHLQALLAAVSTGNNAITSNYSSTSVIGNYEIRSCLRQIQSILMRDDSDFFGGGGGGGGGDIRHYTQEQERHDIHDLEFHNNGLYAQAVASLSPLLSSSPQQQLHHRQVVDDLVKLLTLNDYEDQQEDGGGSGGMELLDSLVPRVVELILASQLPLTDDNLQRLLPHILHSVVEDNDKDDNYSAGASVAAAAANPTTTTTINICRINRFEYMLTLINEHLSVSRLGQVLEEDEDIWIALKILFGSLRRRHHHHGGQYPPLPHAFAVPPRSFQSTPNTDQHEESSYSIQLGLHVLMGKLLEFWKNRMTVSGTSMDGWLRQHFLSVQQQQQPQQHSTCMSSQQQEQQLPQSESFSVITRRQYEFPEDLDRHVEECLRMVEHYGADLLEKTLQLLEEGGRHPNGRSLSHHHYQQEQQPEDGQNEEKDDESGIFLALQYATLATNWISLCMEDFASLSSLTRSVWRTLHGFIVARLEEGDDDGHHHLCIDDATEEGRNNNDEIQMGATDNLWKLTQIQYNCGKMQEQDVSIIVVTIYRMWRYANFFWMPTTKEWVKTNLLSSQNCKYSKEIRRALQVGLLSMLYFPNEKQYYHQQQTTANNTSEEALVLSSLADLLSADEANPEGDQDDNDGDETETDPWYSLVQEQVADFSFQMEQQMRQP